MILFIALILMVGSNCFADLTPFFKPAVNKGTNHSIDGVDFIYTINLDQRPEKFASCLEQLHPYGIIPYRFSAVNGWELPISTVQNVGIPYDPQTMEPGILGATTSSEEYPKFHNEMIAQPNSIYFTHNMRTGLIGIVLSHLSVLYDAYNANYNRIWVMEDDIEIVQDPHLISSMIRKLDILVGKENWDILFTDKDTKDKHGNYVVCLSHAPRPNFKPSNSQRFSQRKQVGLDFMKIGARYGTYSMIIQRSGMKKILDFFNTYNIFLPYDMDFYLPETIQLYTVLSDIVSTQPEALSDNLAPGYKKKDKI